MGGCYKVEVIVANKDGKTEETAGGECCKAGVIKGPQNISVVLLHSVEIGEAVEQGQVGEAVTQRSGIGN